MVQVVSLGYIGYKLNSQGQSHSAGVKKTVRLPLFQCNKIRGRGGGVLYSINKMWIIGKPTDERMARSFSNINVIPEIMKEFGKA